MRSTNRSAGGRSAAGMLFILYCLSSVVAFPQAPSASATPDAVKQALAQINKFRQISGLAPVELDAGLSRGCQLHARYLTLNHQHQSVQGLGSHTELPHLPGYTEEGKRAAENSDISYGSGLSACVDNWMATFYHRIPILRPNLKRIGIGSEGAIVVADIISGIDGEADAAVAYPAAGQSNVPTHFGIEIPDPVPARATRPAGYPITLLFPTFGAELANVRARFVDDAGKNVAFHLSDPQRPATGFPQQNAVCLIPEKPLSMSKTYTVTVTASLDGQEFRKSWSFSTIRSSPALGGMQPAKPGDKGRKDKKDKKVKQGKEE